MKRYTTYLLFVLTLSPLIAHAVSDLSDMMAPGLWKMTLNMQVEGSSMDLPARTIRRCITQAALEKDQGIPQSLTHGNMTCKTISKNHSGHTVSWTMACTGQGKMQVDGTVVFESQQAYHSVVHMSGTLYGRPIQVTQTMQGKRIGECQK